MINITIEELQNRINFLRGQWIKKVGYAYGDNLYLEFDKRFIFIDTDTLLVKRDEGCLSTRYSDWVLTRDNEIISCSDTINDLTKSLILQLENKRLSHCKALTDGNIQLNFNDDYILKIIPNFSSIKDEKDSEDYQEGWELLTPYNEALGVKYNHQRNIIWYSTSSNVPIS